VILALVCALATAEAAEPGELPVATHALQPGTIISDSDVRWVRLDDADLQADTWSDPVGWLVVERILGGEPVRAERLLDPDKPERFAPPGMRVLRIPTPPDRDRKGERVDVKAARATPCVLLRDRFVLGHGRGAHGPDSSWLLVTPDEAMLVLGEEAPMTLSDPTEGPACSP